MAIPPPPYEPQCSRCRRSGPPEWVTIHGQLVCAGCLTMEDEAELEVPMRYSVGDPDDD